MNRQTQELYAGLLTSFYFQVSNNDVDRLIYEELCQHQCEMLGFMHRTPDVIRDNVILKVYQDNRIPGEVQPNVIYVVVHRGEVVSINLHVTLMHLYLIIKQLSVVDVNWPINANLINIDKPPVGFNIMKKFRLGRYYNRFIILGYDDCNVKLVLRQVNNLPVGYIDLRNNPLFNSAVVQMVAAQSGLVQAAQF